MKVWVGVYFEMGERKWNSMWQRFDSMSELWVYNALWGASSVNSEIWDDCKPIANDCDN